MSSPVSYSISWAAPPESRRFWSATSVSVDDVERVAKGPIQFGVGTGIEASDGLRVKTRFANSHQVNPAERA